MKTKGFEAWWEEVVGPEVETFIHYTGMDFSKYQTNDQKVQKIKEFCKRAWHLGEIRGELDPMSNFRTPDY